MTVGGMRVTFADCVQNSPTVATSVAIKLQNPDFFKQISSNQDPSKNIYHMFRDFLFVAGNFISNYFNDLFFIFRAKGPSTTTEGE